MAARSSTRRWSSSPLKRPPSCSRRTVATTGQGRFSSSRDRLTLVRRKSRPQFDQLGALLYQVPVLDDHLAMPPAADADADHEVEGDGFWRGIIETSGRRGRRQHSIIARSRAGRSGAI